MAQMIRRRPVTAAAWIRAPSIPCGFCGEQSGNGTCASLSTADSHVSIFPPVGHVSLSTADSHVSIFPPVGHVSLSTADSHVSIFPPMPHTPLHIQIFKYSLNRRNGWNLGSSYKKKALLEIGGMSEKHFHFSFLLLQIRARRQDGRNDWMINWASAAEWRGTTLLLWRVTHKT